MGECKNAFGVEFGVILQQADGSVGEIDGDRVQVRNRAQQRVQGITDTTPTFCMAIRIGNR